MKKLSIAFLWHMHQPLYKSSQNRGVYLMPWVRLHAVKDYLDMLLILDNHPDIKLNFNFVPVLLDALIDYQDDNTHDIHSKLTICEVENLTYDDKVFILNNFFDANYQNMVAKNHYFNELYKKRMGMDEINVDYFSNQEYSDILALFNLVWMDPGWKKIYPEIDNLLNKHKNYTLLDRMTIISIQRDIIKKIIPNYKKYQFDGKIELQTSPYYHPIMPLLLNMKDAKNSQARYPMPSGNFKMQDDAFMQVKMALDRMEEIFEVRPKGIWPSEHCLSESVVKCLSKADVKWTISDEGILASSLKKEFIRDNRGCILDPYNLTQVYNYKHQNKELSLIFRNSVFPNLISFEYPLHDTKTALDDIYDRIKSFQSRLQNSPDDNHLLLIAMDGENSWESFENDGYEFLDGLYSQIESDPTLKTVLLSDYIDDAKKIPIKSISAGSWINRNFQLWACEPTKNLAWEYLNKTYDDLMHFKKTEKISDDKINKCKNELYIAQGSDWFWWYGEPNDSGQDHIFDYLFREHLSNVYKILGKPIPDKLNAPLISFLGKPSRSPKKIINPDIIFVPEYLDSQWEQAGFIEIPSRPIMEDRKILDKIFFGANEEKIFFRFDINPYFKTENNIYNEYYQIFIYFKHLNQKFASPIRTLLKNDSVYPILREKYNFEIKIPFIFNKNISPSMSFASENGLWMYSLNNSLNYYYKNNTLIIAVPFSVFSVDFEQNIEFCILTSIFDRVEEVFPQDSVLNLKRLRHKESIISNIGNKEGV